MRTWMQAKKMQQPLLNEDMDASEEDAAAFAKAEMQKAVEALDTVFAK